MIITAFKSHLCCCCAGGLGAGQLLLGGVDPSLASTPFISTPLQPNLWRTDFQTGRDIFVFWQFTPLSIRLVNPYGRTMATLCNQRDLSAKSACTVIADSGYDSVVIGNSGALRAVQAATAPTGRRCASAIQVRTRLRFVCASTLHNISYDMTSCCPRVGSCLVALLVHEAEITGSLTRKRSAQSVGLTAAKAPSLSCVVVLTVNGARQHFSSTATTVIGLLAWRCLAQSTVVATVQHAQLQPFTITAAAAAANCHRSSCPPT
jgi:hypothetical protein